LQRTKVNADYFPSGDSGQRIIPQRFPKDHDTHILIQIRGAFTVTIGSELGEVTKNGAQYNQANTSPPARVRWRGDLWHTASVGGSQWILIIAAEEKQQEQECGCGDCGD